MRRLMVGVLAFAVALPAGAHAQSESDRLREALRSATAQARALEDQRVAMQAKQAELEKERDRLRRQVDGIKADLKNAMAQQRQAVEDFNARLTEREDTLEKWKAAYAEAAGVARAKDAERARLEGEAATFKARNAGCEAKNVKLYRIGSDILGRFEGVNLGTVVTNQEPFIGVRRVELQNLVQDYKDKILDQRFDQVAADQAPAPPPAAAGDKPAAVDQKAGDKAGNQKSTQQRTKP